MSSKAPYTIPLNNPEHAKELIIKGATLVILDVPEGTAIGIDQQMFLVGPKFRGVKMLLPGPHVVAYRSSGGQGAFSPTTCFFVHPKGGQVVSWKWDASNEILVPITDGDEVDRIVNAVKTFQMDQYLAPYDLNRYAQWRRLSGHINRDVIDTIQPTKGGNINILAESTVPGAASTAAEAALEEHLKQHHSSLGVSSSSSNEQASTSSAAPHAGSCLYTPLPRGLVKRSGLTPADLTALNLDKSKILEQLLVTSYDNNESQFLGEFEFSFLAFIIGQSFESFEQWKSILVLMMSCEEAALESRSGLFIEFLHVLFDQLKLSFEASVVAEEQENDDTTAASAVTTGCFDILSEDMMQDMFLRRMCQQWFTMLKEEEEAGRVLAGLQQQAHRVKSLLERRLGWDLCGADDEDGPVIVET